MVCAIDFSITNPDVGQVRDYRFWEAAKAGALCWKGMWMGDGRGR